MRLLIFCSIIVQILGQCYDDIRNPIYCEPKEENIALKSQIKVSNIQVGYSIVHLTDPHDDSQETWWQSQSMFEGKIQHPNTVNISFSLEKSFNLSQIQIIFKSPRPESFAIFKRTQEKSSNWEILQYFSSSCDGLHPCTTEFSDITPLSGGMVTYSSATIASDFLIVLQRLNTFGDEIFGTPDILKSYYYAIYDVNIRAKCHCNGHASECSLKQTPNFEEKLVCNCEHNTFGDDCDRCLPFYQDLSWDSSGSFECRSCECNGKSNKCFFDQKLFNQTGHGGHCIDCKENTAGVHCEKCKNGFYQVNGSCAPCNCNSVGSINSKCNEYGECVCKIGVSGDKCDQCMNNFYDLTSNGCKPCDCTPHGINNTHDNCDKQTGRCFCKENIEGFNCEKCKKGFFNFDQNNPLGCTKCFCFGHSQECSSADGFYESVIESLFVDKTEQWSIIYDNDFLNQSISDSSVADFWFVASNKFRGDQRSSYDQELNFRMIPNRNVSIIIIENSKAGLSIAAHLVNNHHNEFQVKLNEVSGWMPKLSLFEFKVLLSNISSIRIKAPRIKAHVYLERFSLKKALFTNSSINSSVVNSIENCKCPIGYDGLSCDKCQEGFYRLDPLDKCLPCLCNNHSKSCDPVTGKCFCVDNTAGQNCEKCSHGYYGNALNGLPQDCKKCACVGDGPCEQVSNEIICLNCSRGHIGNRCDNCQKGYFMSNEKCIPCNCNGNNLANICEPFNGTCLNCMFNTTGDKCDRCSPGFYEDPLSKSFRCISCECNAFGSNGIECEQMSGQCKCKSNVVGLKCDECKKTYWNLHSSDGCTSCNCDFIGSISNVCDKFTGKCNCLDGVGGLKCDRCEEGYSNFTEMGCSKCNCNVEGSLPSNQCDQNEVCECDDNYVGDKCDACVQNYYNSLGKCEKCDQCYDLVKVKFESLRQKIDSLRSEYILNQNNSWIYEIIERFKELEDPIVQLYEQFIDGNIFVRASSRKKICSLIELVPVELQNQLKLKEYDYNQYLIKVERIESIFQCFSYAELQLSMSIAQIGQAEFQIKSIESKNFYKKQNKFIELVKKTRKKAKIEFERIQNLIKILYKSINQSAYIKDNLVITINEIFKLTDNPLMFNFDNFNMNFAQIMESVGVKQRKIRIYELMSKHSKDLPTQSELMENNAAIQIHRYKSKHLRLKINSFDAEFESQMANMFTVIPENLIRKFNEYGLLKQDYLKLNESVSRLMPSAHFSLETAHVTFQNVSLIYGFIKNLKDLKKKNNESSQNFKELKHKIDSNNKISQMNAKLINHEINRLQKNSNILDSRLTQASKYMSEDKMDLDRLKSKSLVFHYEILSLNDKAIHVENKFKSIVIYKIALRDNQERILKKASNQIEGIISVRNQSMRASEIINNKNIHKIALMKIDKHALENIEQKLDFLLNKREVDYDERISYLEARRFSINQAIKSIERQINMISGNIQRLKTLSKQLNNLECLTPKRFNYFEIN